MKFAGRSSLIIGLLMLLKWTFFLGAGQVPEIQTEPMALAFHLAAEAATAVALISAGVLLLRGRPFGITLGLVANGMLVYTVIVSPGYFAQLVQWDEWQQSHRALVRRPSNGIKQTAQALE